MPTHINQALLAQQLDLSQSQVSLALRGVGRVSAVTRAKVLAAAERLGYRPDPMQSSFGLRHRGRVQQAPVIAWVGPIGTSVEGYYHAVLARATALGYELITLPDSTALASRRVVGVIYEHNAGFERLDLPVVQVGLHHAVPEVPVVCIDLRAEIALCLQRVRERGHQHIRVVMMTDFPQVTFPILKDMLQGEAERLGNITYEFHPWSEAIEMIERVAGEDDPRALITNHIPLAQAGVKRGRPVAGLFQHQPELSGTVMDIAGVGVVAMDLLDSRIRQRDLRLGGKHQTVLVPPNWHEGDTLPDLRKGISAG